MNEASGDSAQCDACMDDRCADCEVYAELDEMGKAAVDDYWAGYCCCSIPPLAAPRNGRQP